MADGDGFGRLGLREQSHVDQDLLHQVPAEPGLTSQRTDADGVPCGRAARHSLTFVRASSRARRGRPGRGASVVRASRPPNRNRSRHSLIVGSLIVSTCDARCTEYPDASCRMIRLRRTTRAGVPGVDTQRINCSRWYSLRTMGTLGVTDTVVAPSLRAGTRSICGTVAGTPLRVHAAHGIAHTKVRRCDGDDAVS